MRSIFSWLLAAWLLLVAGGDTLGARLVHELPHPGAAGGWVGWQVEGVLEGAGDAADGAHPDAVAELAGQVFFPPAEEDFTYDADGNRESSALWNYGWDGRNRLVRARTKNFDDPATPEAYDIKFDYDAEGRRFKKEVTRYANGQIVEQKTVYFIWDGWDLIYERHQDQFGNRLLERSYVWGPDLSSSHGGAGGAGGLHLIREKRGQTTRDYYPLFDGSGHLVGLADHTGKLVAEYWYGPFGELISASGPMATANPWRYATKYLDHETGLYYFGLRYYDPATGQWLNREPLGESESLNLYSYCHNDPVNRVDVLGLAAISFDGSLYFTSLFPKSAKKPEIRFGFTLDAQPDAIHRLAMEEAERYPDGLPFDPKFEYRRTLLEQAGFSILAGESDSKVLHALLLKEFFPNKQQTPVLGYKGEHAKGSLRHHTAQARQILWSNETRYLPEHEAVKLASHLVKSAETSSYVTTNALQRERQIMEGIMMVPEGLILAAGWTPAGRGVAVPKQIATRATGTGGTGTLTKMMTRGAPRTTPSSFARSLQGAGDYPGVDRFRDITLKRGTTIFGGAPGQSNFYTTASGVRRANGSSSSLFQGLQVGKAGPHIPSHPITGRYRPGVTAYEITQDIPAAFGRTLNNPQFGSGRFPQIVIENYQDYLRPVYSIPLGK